MKPNMIYILSDQHHAGVMGCGGDAYVRTPCLDDLRERSTMLEQCYCAAPLCVPSRSSILTGLLPTHTGVYNNMQCLSSDKATFVNLLTIAGYETVLSGRMHFVGLDQRHGYEKRLVGDITPCFIGGDNEEEIYGSFKRSSGQNLTSIKKSGAGHSAVLDFDRDVADAACDYLRNRRDERPLFMTIGFYGPHCPYIAPKELYDYYYEILPELPDMTEEERKNLHPAILRWYENRRMEEVKKEDVRRIRAAYYAMVEYMDSLVGEVLKAVEETLGLDNTLIVYTSDHGDNIGEHGLFWKTNFYDGAARVPAMFSWKGHVKENESIGGITSLMDLAPTLLEVGEAPCLPLCDGRSLWESLTTGKEVDLQRSVLSMCSDIKGDNPSAMVRKGRYKLVVHAGYPEYQLFDMETDPGEFCDLGKKEEYKTIAEELRRELHGSWEEKEMLQRLEADKQHFRYMKQWYDQVKPPLVEEWRGDSRRNYLLSC